MRPRLTDLEQLFVFVHRCPTAVVRIRRDGRIDLANPAACELLVPISTGEISNLFDLLDPFEPGLRGAVSAFTDEVGIVVDRLQIRLPGAPEEPRVVALTMIAVGGEACVALLSDVTHQVEQARLAYMQEQLLRAVVDCAEDYALITLDAQGNVDSWNRSVERLTGLDPDEVLGRPLDALVVGRWRSSLGDLLATARRSGWVEYAAAHRRGDDEEFRGEGVLTPLLGQDGETDGFAVVLRDATAKERYEEALVRLSTQDPLTGILHRRAFFDAADRDTTRSLKRSRDRAILRIDVEGLRAVNDAHGHDAGDRVLRAVVTAIQHEIRPADVLGRIGGDELAVLATDMSLGDALDLAERVCDAAAASEVQVPGGRVRFTASVGVAAIPAGSTEPFESALRRADDALQEAKRGGRGQISIGGIEVKVLRAS